MIGQIAQLGRIECAIGVLMSLFVLPERATSVLFGNAARFMKRRRRAFYDFFGRSLPLELAV